ncbi:hypothetical protein [Parabacteroides sp. An277]|uniref:hypothetical protein n=1 Tax=Parabacteroides sp. An277 TaxID=1965619 RepID=UPI00111FE905|nr:hypothetical protein [Parabacteroides sp. An277]
MKFPAAGTCKIVVFYYSSGWKGLNQGFYVFQRLEGSKSRILRFPAAGKLKIGDWMFSSTWQLEKTPFRGK